MKYRLVALSVLGSAILLCSCNKNNADSDAASQEAMMTEYSENYSIVESQNGRRSYHFVTPLLEGYTLAREPYREFRKGVKITTFQDDSLSTVDAVLTANYAIYYINRKLWEAKGNVVIKKTDGTELYTQQLFWNASTKKIYSNVDTKYVQKGGRSIIIGEGFVSDEEFKAWTFRKQKSRMEVDMTPRENADSAAVVTSAPEPMGKSGSKPASAPAPRPATPRPDVRKEPLAEPQADIRRESLRDASHEAVEMKMIEKR